MKVEVTFEQSDLAFQPAFDTIIPMDSGAARVRGILDGSISGVYMDDKITHLRMGAFSQCNNLTYVSLPNCVAMDKERAFYQCSNIVYLDLPRLETIGNGTYSFGEMTNLEELNLPNLRQIGTMSGTFRFCSNLKRINLPKLSGTSIQGLVFQNCTRLETIILGGEVLNPLENANPFAYANKLTGIYVPDGLLDRYKTATNWVAFADKIKPMSELEA